MSKDLKTLVGVALVIVCYGLLCSCSLLASGRTPSGGAAIVSGDAVLDWETAKATQILRDAGVL